MAIEITVGELIDELKEYPEDTPIWPQLKLSWGMLMLDLEFIRYASLDGGNSYDLHMVFKESKIYDEIKKRSDVK